MVKNTHWKDAEPVPQISRQAGYVIPHASERLEVKAPSGFTRNTEVEELERAKDRARAAHSIESKLEVEALVVATNERKRNRKMGIEINEQGGRGKSRTVMTVVLC